MFRNQDQFAIWDLDNCLADDRARIRLIDWTKTDPTERYAAYHAAGALDPVRNENVFHAISQLARPVFFTGRPEAVRTAATRWIRCELDVEAPLVLMRPDGCTCSAVELKRAMISCYAVQMHEQRNVQACYAAFDDREDIVDMYRSFGIPAALLSIHSVSAYIEPKGVSK